MDYLIFMVTFWNGARITGGRNILEAKWKIHYMFLVRLTELFEEAAMRTESMAVDPRIENIEVEAAGMTLLDLESPLFQLINRMERNSGILLNP